MPTPEFLPRLHFAAGLVLLAACTLLLTGCDTHPNVPSVSQTPSQPSATTFQKIKKAGVIRAGYVLAKPWVYKNPDTGELAGSFVDSMNKIALEMGVRVEYVEATFATFAAGLQSGQYDVSIAPTFSTIPRAMAIAFTTPLGALGNSAIVRQNETRFKTLADLDKKGVVIAVTQGEQGHEYAKTHVKNAEIKVIAGSDQNLTFSEVLARRADVALGDAWFAANFAAQHPQAHDLFGENPYNVTPAAWAVRYEDLDLLAFLNTALDVLETNGTLDQIDKKYNANWLRPKRIWTKS